ncbi:hypothetical protein T484DRAFT_1775441 [Baffinella frigidus]|nr:hypothetical protein T484DRAFT_1775441 [Cryptophyta sp. CCMP2293]
MQRYREWEAQVQALMLEYTAMDAAALFTAIDTDNSGSLDQHEVEQAFKRVFARDPTLDYIALARDFMQAADADGNGLLSEQEVADFLRGITGGGRPVLPEPAPAPAALDAEEDAPVMLR